MLFPPFSGLLCTLPAKALDYRNTLAGSDKQDLFSVATFLPISISSFLSSFVFDLQNSKSERQRGSAAPLYLLRLPLDLLLAWASSALPCWVGPLHTTGCLGFKVNAIALLWWLSRGRGCPNHGIPHHSIIHSALKLLSYAHSQ